MGKSSLVNKVMFSTAERSESCEVENARETSVWVQVGVHERKDLDVAAWKCVSDHVNVNEKKKEREGSE